MHRAIIGWHLKFDVIHYLLTILHPRPSYCQRQCLTSFNLQLGSYWHSPARRRYSTQRLYLQHLNLSLIQPQYKQPKASRLSHGTKQTVFNFKPQHKVLRLIQESQTANSVLAVDVQSLGNFGRVRSSQSQVCGMLIVCKQHLSGIATTGAHYSGNSAHDQVEIGSQILQGYWESLQKRIKNMAKSRFVNIPDAIAGKWCACTQRLSTGLPS